MDLELKFLILLLLVLADVVLLMWLSSRWGRVNRSKCRRFFLSAASALYVPLMTYILSYLTNNLSSLANQSSTHDCVSSSTNTNGPLNRLAQWGWVVMLTVLVHSLKSTADTAALAVAAAASLAAGADDIDSKKIRPSMDRLVDYFSVAVLVIYTTRVYAHKDPLVYHLFEFFFVLFLYWALGAVRMVLTYDAFRRANGSFAIGRNAQLIDGYMAQGIQPVLVEALWVPRLILWGEKNDDVEETPQGYRVKLSALQHESSRLVTLDKVWSSCDHRLSQELKDLCLSFSLFKCLRTRFAGYRQTEALPFLYDGLLGKDDDHQRMFRVIAHELSFASDFYYSPLPVASLGVWPAALHFILSLLICAPLLIVSLYAFIFIPIFLYQFIAKQPDQNDHADYIALTLLTTVGGMMEIWALVTSVRSNWTKICMVAHCINGSRWSGMISPRLLRCKSPMHWKDEIGQNLLVNPSPAQDHWFKQILLAFER